MLPLLACGAGVYLGLYFNILVLLPFSALGAGAYIVTSWGAGQNLLDSAGVLLLPIVGIQVGYFLGLTSRPAYSHLLARFNVAHSKRV